MHLLFAEKGISDIAIIIVLHVNSGVESDHACRKVKIKSICAEEVMQQYRGLNIGLPSHFALRRGCCL